MNPTSLTDCKSHTEKRKMFLFFFAYLDWEGDRFTGNIYIYICNGNLTRISTEIDFTRLFLIEKYRMLLTQTHLASKKGFFMCFSKSFLACSRTYRSENGDGLTLRIERLPKCNSGTCTTVIYIKIS